MTPLFDNLRILLNDICKFLEKEIIQGRLGDDAKAMATELLTRSSTMIEITQKQIVDTAGYLDMKKKHYIDEYITSDAAPILQTDDDKVYSNPDENNDKLNDTVADKIDKPDQNDNMDESITLRVSVCPYINVGVNDLGTVGKSGYLLRKEYVFHFIGWQRKYFVVLLDKWLMFFHSNKRGKPLEIFDMKLCLAEDNDDVGGNFLVHIDSKTYLMVADTRKEKLQWVTKINETVKKDNIISSLLETPPLNKTHDQIKHDSIGSDSSNIYNDIDEDRLHHPPQPPSLPCLPPQRCLQPEYMNSEETYDFLPAHQVTSTPTLPPPRVSNVKLPEDDETYDLVANPSAKSNPDPPKVEQSVYPPDDEIYDFIQEAPVSDCRADTKSNNENQIKKEQEQSSSNRESAINANASKSPIKTPKKETSNVLKLKKKLRMDSNNDTTQEDSDNPLKSPDKGKKSKSSLSFRLKK